MTPLNTASRRTPLRDEANPPRTIVLVSADLADLQRLDIKAVSALTGRSASSLREMVREGRFPEPAEVDGPRFTRWTAGAVRQWLQQNTRQGA